MKYWANIALIAIFSTGCASVSNQDTTSNVAQSTNIQPSAEPGERPITLGGTPAQGAQARAPMAWAQSHNYTAEGPFPVYLPSIPSGVYDPKNKLARGWGKDGVKRITKRISKEEANRLRREALGLTPNANIDTGAEGIRTLAPIVGTNFDSLDINDCCGGGVNVPPDPELAVGPNHIIAIVNVAFAIYDKSGTLISGPTTLSSFFAGTPGCTNTATFDPNVLYDEQADRFIIGVDGNGTEYCVAATTGSSPLGTWARYSFPTDIGGAFFDFPHAGVGVDAIFMGSNQFGGVPGFEGRVFAMDKAALYAGSPMAVATQSTGTDGTPQPMNLHGFNQGTWPSTGPHYTMTEVFNGSQHTVWSWADPFGANIFSRDGDVNLNVSTGVVAGFPIDVPQLGSAARLQGNDWRGLDTEYRNGEIWMSNTISCNPGTGTVNCIRWARIDPTGPTILDSGVYATNGHYRTFPDVAVNHCGDMAIGYTKSSTAMYPSVWMTGRESGDAPGTLQADTEVKAGEISYTAFDAAPHRWGDYTGMTIDPDGQTFWYLGEYSKNTGNPDGRWGTYIGSFSYAACGGSTAFALDNAVPGNAGVINEWSIAGATPAGLVALVYGGTGGSSDVTIPSCPKFTVAINNARLGGTNTADGAGNALVSKLVPASFAGKTALIQAIDVVSCSVSNVVVDSF